jgi:hypothetical protein
LTYREKIDIPFTIVLLNILIHTYLNSIYFSVKYCGVLPQAEAKSVPHFMAI